MDQRVYRYSEDLYLNSYRSIAIVYLTYQSILVSRVLFSILLMQSNVLLKRFTKNVTLNRSWSNFHNCTRGKLCHVIFHHSGDFSSFFVKRFWTHQLLLVTFYAKPPYKCMSSFSNDPKQKVYFRLSFT